MISFCFFFTMQAVEKVLAGAIRREMALEDFCAKQTSEIMQLNRLVGFFQILPIPNSRRIFSVGMTLFHFLLFFLFFVFV